MDKGATSKTRSSRLIIWNGLFALDVGEEDPLVSTGTCMLVGEDC